LNNTQCDKSTINQSLQQINNELYDKYTLKIEGLAYNKFTIIPIINTPTRCTACCLPNPQQIEVVEFRHYAASH